MKKKGLFEILMLLLIVLIIGFYNLSRTDELKYVEEKAKSITSDTQLQKELIETNKAYYRDKDGQTYLIGPDPYLYYRIARNLVELGTINDSVNPENEDYSPADSLRFAPIGTVMQKEFMPYAIYYFHRAWNVFSTATLSKTAFYLPVFFGLISILTVFFLVLIAAKNTYAAFFSSFLLAMHPTFVAFNFGGYTDTHVIAMALSLAILLFFIAIFKAKNVLIRIASAILTIAFIYLFKFSWRGWFFVIALMGVYSFFETVNILRNNFDKKNNKNIMICAPIFILILGFAFVLHQNDAIKSTIERITVSQKISELPPSSFGTVNELQSLSLSTLSSYFGGTIIFILILIAAMNILRKQNRSEPFNWFVLIWFLIFVVLGKFSMRFLFFASPPSAMLLGLLICNVTKYFGSSKKKIAASFALFVLLSVILYPSTREVWQNGPMMNDAIEETGLFLQQNTPKGSVLNVWWDAGYYWQTFARRGTTTDGGLFETPKPFYFANAAITNNSGLSRKINLATGCGIDEFPYKKDFENKTFEEGLKEMLSKSNFSKCNNEVYLIIDERTLLMTPTFYPYSQKPDGGEKNLVDKILEKGSFSLGGLTSKDLPYISPIIDCENINNNIVKCNNHVVDTQKIAFQGTPLNSLIVVKNRERNEKYYNPESTNVSLIVFQEEGNRFRAMLMDKKIKDSTIVRAFAGEKIEGFEKVYETHLPVRIAAFKLNS